MDVFYCSVILKSSSNKHLILNTADISTAWLLVRNVVTSQLACAFTDDSRFVAYTLKFACFTMPHSWRYLFPKGMSVMIMSTELVLMGKLHRSHCTVSIGNPGVLCENKQLTSLQWASTACTCDSEYGLMSYSFYNSFVPSYLKWQTSLCDIQEKNTTKELPKGQKWSQWACSNI